MDTPGIEGDATFLNGLIMPEYRKVVSLVKVAGFQRPAIKMVPGTYISPSHPTLFGFLYGKS